MAVGGSVLAYRILELVDVEHGHWCDQCALPSAAKVSLASQTQLGTTLGPLKLSTRLRCTEGHGWIGKTL